MRSSEALGHLLRLGRPIMETREAATLLGVSVSRASHLLESLEEAGLARRLRRGLWALQSDVDPFVVPPHLMAPLPAYVSFWSALARSQSIVTPAGVYSIHHLTPELFDGYTGSEQAGYIAMPEKALFDTVYLRAAAGGQQAMPELELPPDFHKPKLEEWTGRVARQRLRTLVSRGLEKALGGAITPG